MRSIWGTSLSWGMVDTAVKVYTATESHDLKLHQHHGPDCLGSIRYKRVCEVCSNEVEYSDIVSGTDESGSLVTVTKSELESLDDEQELGGIEVLGFVHSDEINPIYYDKTYYLDADTGKNGKNKAPAKSYALLRQVLEESGRVGVVRYTSPRSHHTVRGVLCVYQDTLTIHTLLWHDEVRDPSELKNCRQQMALKPEEIKMAHQVVESMAAVWKNDELTDTYQERLGELIDTKIAGGEFTTAPKPDDTEADSEDVSDLLAKLQASVKAKGAK